jgi:hypothetical protein
MIINKMDAGRCWKTEEGSGLRLDLDLDESYAFWSWKEEKWIHVTGQHRADVPLKKLEDGTDTAVDTASRHAEGMEVTLYLVGGLAGLFASALGE